MSGGMPVKVLHERPADDLGGFDVFSCCPIIEPRLNVDGQPNGRVFPLGSFRPAGRPPLRTTWAPVPATGSLTGSQAPASMSACSSAYSASVRRRVLMMSVPSTCVGYCTAVISKLQYSFMRDHPPTWPGTRRTVCGVASQLASIGPQAPVGRSATCGFGNISALGANSSSASS